MIDRRLQVLRVVRQHGTITAAATALHLTPSAVSQQLRNLARDLDVELLAPRGRGIVLTPAADIVLEHADALFARWEQARADLDRHRDGLRGRVRVCGFPTAVVALLAPVVRQLRVDAPGLEVEVSQAEPTESLDRLLSGAADIAVLEASPVVPATRDPRFDQRSLLDEVQQLIVPAEHPLAGRGAVALRDVADDPWIRGPDAYHHIVVHACNRAGFTPRTAHHADDWSAYSALVAAGLGVALVPRLALLPSGSVRRLDLLDRPAPTRRVLTCVRRGSAERATIRLVHDALEDRAAAHRD